MKHVIKRIDLLKYKRISEMGKGNGKSLNVEFISKILRPLASYLCIFILRLRIHQRLYRTTELIRIWILVVDRDACCCF